MDRTGPVSPAQPRGLARPMTLSPEGSRPWDEEVPPMVSSAGKSITRKAAVLAAEVEQERLRLRQELLQRILAREVRRQAMRRAPR